MLRASRMSFLLSSGVMNVAHLSCSVRSVHRVKSTQATTKTTVWSYVWLGDFIQVMRCNLCVCVCSCSEIADRPLPDLPPPVWRSASISVIQLSELGGCSGLDWIHKSVEVQSRQVGHMQMWVCLTTRTVLVCQILNIILLCLTMKNQSLADRPRFESRQNPEEWG